MHVVVYMTQGNIRPGLLTSEYILTTNVDKRIVIDTHIESHKRME